VAPLGRGGFGEVWRCDAPGGLPKAIKFVLPDSGNDRDRDLALRQEFEAFEHIKLIRHPFLLMLERVELLDGELLMVMELADHNLWDRFKECRKAGQPGVPRDELLGYLTDVAEALDTIATRHALQHLDVKPGNLFLVGGHAKLGDFGLVQRFEHGGSRSGQMSKALTPRYVPPEVIDGQVHPRSDQYSLALVYHEMLTGTFPYPAKNIRDLILMHSTGVPDLTPLPFADRRAVSRALAKNPGERFPSCLAFLRALLGVSEAADAVPVTRSGLIRHMHRRVPPPPPVEPPKEPETVAPESPTMRLPARVVLPRLRVISSVARLIGADSTTESGGRRAAFLAALMDAVGPSADTVDPQAPPRVAGSGKWVCQFTADAEFVAEQLTVACASGEMMWSPTGPGSFVVYQTVTSSLWAKLSGTADSMVVNIKIPDRAGRMPVGEMMGEWLGRSETANGDLVRQLMRDLQTRFQPAVRPALSACGSSHPVRLYPVDDEGGVLRPVRGRCRTVTDTGLVCTLDGPVTTGHAFVEFPDVMPIRGSAILTKLLRSPSLPGETPSAVGQFYPDE
jgi:serine/threonine protein kinase